jgi:site-specific DNA recombinase
MARLIDAYEDGLLQKQEFEPRIQTARERLARLEAEAAAQSGRERQQEDLRFVVGQLQAFAEQVRQGLDKADWATRQGIIRALVRRVEIGPEEIRIVYRVTPRPFDPSPTGGALPDCPWSRCPMAEKWPLRTSPPKGPMRPWHTVGLDIPRPVARLQSRTPLLQAMVILPWRGKGHNEQTVAGR